MYKFITCPKTGSIFTVNSKQGDKIIMNYANHILMQTSENAELDIIETVISKTKLNNSDRNIIQERLNIIKKYFTGSNEKFIKNILLREFEISDREGDIRIPSDLLGCLLDNSG